MACRENPLALLRMMMVPGTVLALIVQVRRKPCCLTWNTAFVSACTAARSGSFARHAGLYSALHATRIGRELRLQLVDIPLRCRS